MRNWNGTPSPSESKSEDSFIACLWGIETLFLRFSLLLPLLVYRVPMRNWNSTRDLYFFLNLGPVYRVPMRNWNENLLGPQNQTKRVYRVPMRNWNFYFHVQIKRPHFLFIACLWGIETEKRCEYGKETSKVYRVPMRNWNILVSILVPPVIVVYRVPMRNWNQCNWCGSKIELYVYRVPMRNWNLIELELFILLFLSLSRAYEELKPIILIIWIFWVI